MIGRYNVFSVRGAICAESVFLCVWIGGGAFLGPFKEEMQALLLRDFAFLAILAIGFSTMLGLMQGSKLLGGLAYVCAIGAIVLYSHTPASLAPHGRVFAALASSFLLLALLNLWYLVSDPAAEYEGYEYADPRD
jgi:hypothetical protein